MRAVVVVTIAGLALTATVFGSLRSARVGQFRLQFDADAAVRVSLIRERLHSDLLVLSAIARYRATHDPLDSAGFGSFCAPFLVGRTGNVSFEWVPRVRRDDLARFEAAMRSEGSRGFRITPEPGAARPADDLYPIALVSPAGGNVSPLGLDLASDPVRFEAMRRARDLGRPVATPRVSSADGTEDGQGVFWVFAPVYTESAAVSTVPERRAALTGFAVGVYRLDELMRDVLAPTPRLGMPFELRDLSDPFDERTMYQWVPRLKPTGEWRAWRRYLAPAAPRFRQDFRFAGRRWSMTVHAGDAYLEHRSPLEHWYVIPVGLALTLLAASYAGSLRRQHARLATLVKERDAANEELERRVSERTSELVHANESLRAANLGFAEALDRLDRATRAKSDFLAAMSHELHTPLNSVIGFSGVLLEGMTGPLNEEQGEQLSIINAAGRRLLTLIDAVLEASGVDEGRVRLELTEFDPRDAVLSAVETIRPAANAKSLALTCDASGLAGTMRSDRSRFEGVLTALLDNAVKFTDSGGVTVVARREGADVVVSVGDTGRGIAPEDLTHVFEDFYQAANRASGKTPGTGIGLPLAARSARLLGGGIMVRSALDVGTTFIVTAPAIAPQGAGGPDDDAGRSREREGAGRCSRPAPPAWGMMRVSRQYT